MMSAIPIRTRLLAAYTFLFGVVLVGFSVVIYTVVREERFTGLRTAMESHAEKLHSEIEEQVDRGTFPRTDDLREIVTEGLTDDHFRIASPGGAMVYDDPLFTVLDSVASHENNEPTRWSCPIVIGDISYGRLSTPLEIEGRTTFILDVAASAMGIERDLDRLRWLLFFAVPLTLAVAGLIAAWLARAAFRPVSDIITTANRIRGEELGERIPVPPVNDEISELATTLNSMIGRIDVTLRSQRRFLADASHELRTPLTVIRSELEFALRSVTDAGARESLHTSLAEVSRLSRLAEGLLTLARLEAAQQTPVRKAFRLDELLLECVQSLRTVADAKRISFAVQIGGAVSLVGDQERLRSAILNLLDNALKFSPAGGTIECLLAADKNSVCVTIGDRGPGIRSDEISRVFERFYQSEETRSGGTGAGLGLAIVDRVIKLHGGTVGVDSQPGQGATFSFTLPVGNESGPNP